MIQKTFFSPSNIRKASYCYWKFDFFQWSEKVKHAFSRLHGPHRQKTKLSLLNHPDSFLQLIYQISLFFKIFKFYLFLERRREGEKGRETLMCSCLSSVPNWGPGQQPRHVPQLGTESATLWLTVPHSIHSATPARARSL